MYYNPAVKDQRADIIMRSSADRQRAISDIGDAAVGFFNQKRADDRAELLAGEEVAYLDTTLDLIKQTTPGVVTPEMMEQYSKGSIGAKRAIAIRAGKDATGIMAEQQRTQQLNDSQKRSQENVAYAQSLRDQAAQASRQVNDQQDRATNVYLAQQAYRSGQIDEATLGAIARAPTVESQAALMKGLQETQQGGLGEITVEDIDGIGQVIRTPDGRVLDKYNVFNPPTNPDGTPAAVPGAAADGSLFPGQPVTMYNQETGQLQGVTPEQFNSIGGASGYVPPAPAEPVPPPQAAAASASSPSLPPAAPIQIAGKTSKGEPVVDKGAFYTNVTSKIAQSELNGLVPKDGAKYGITTGAPEEWARFFTGLADMESSFRTSLAGDIGRFNGNSNGLFQLSPDDGPNHGLTKSPIPVSQLQDPDFNTDAAIKIAANLVKRDGVIAGKDGGKHLGASAYWGPLRRGMNPSERFDSLGVSASGPSPVQPETTIPRAQPVQANPAAAPSRFFTRGQQ